MGSEKIERTQAKIRRIQDGYEADPPVYTASEAEEGTRVYRERISHAETKVHRLQDLKQQHVVNKETKEEARRILEVLRDMNLDKASFSEKQDLTTKLGIKVYPSEDGKVVRISSKLQPDPCPLKLSPQIISMASPKL